MPAARFIIQPAYSFNFWRPKRRIIKLVASVLFYPHSGSQVGNEYPMKYVKLGEAPSIVNSPRKTLHSLNITVMTNNLVKICTQAEW